MWPNFLHPQLLMLMPICILLVYITAKRRPIKSKKTLISHVLRYILIVLTILALAGTSLPISTGEKVAWILIDASASMATNQTEADQIIHDAIAAEQDMQKIGVIAYGKNSMVEIPLSDSPIYSGISTAIDASASDLSQALALASALLPSDASGGIAVISDGLLEDADTSTLQSRGIPVNTLQLSSPRQTDAQVSHLDLPNTAYQGQDIPVTVTVHSTISENASIVLTANGRVSATRDVTLRSGENTFVFRDIAAQPGVVAYEAQVIMPGDNVSQNDRSASYITVSGAPSILIIEGQSGAGNELGKMLRASGMSVEMLAPSHLPENAGELRAYHAVSLVNVDADTLTDKQITALSSAVKELGIGVAVFGGDSSYALGGYRGSALESMLPVTIDIKNKADLPSTALIMVIDKSGSMTDAQYGVTRLDVAKEAACRAIEVLNEKDFAGVIAFDDTGKWVVPLSNVTDVASIQEQIGTIRPGGGTAFYTPLAMANDAMSQVTAQHKHIIFLTDGESGDTGYDMLAENMAQQGITLTTVAVGNGADVGVLRHLAQLGGGRAYAAGQFDNVPKIFTKETLLIAGTYVQNRTFTPIITDNSMTDFEGFPTLNGYHATTEKALATVSLISDSEDPLLAWWQYGAGRVLCWTSDVQGAWSTNFLAWNDASSFFSGMISHILPNSEQSGEMLLENGILSYTAVSPMEDAQVVAQVLFPDGTYRNISLEQVSPSRYESGFEVPEIGAYAIQIEMYKDGEVIATLDSGAVVPYSQEYDQCIDDTGTLQRLSSATGGINTEDASELLAFSNVQAQTDYPLQSLLLFVALILFLMDIAQQRLNWEKAAIKHADKKQVKPTVSKKNKVNCKPKKTVADPVATSEQLWQNLQKKQRM